MRILLQFLILLCVYTVYTTADSVLCRIFNDIKEQIEYLNKPTNFQWIDIIECQKENTFFYKTEWKLIGEKEIQYDINIRVLTEQNIEVYFLQQIKSNTNLLIENTCFSRSRNSTLLTCYSIEIPFIDELSNLNSNSLLNSEILQLDNYNTTRYINMSHPGTHLQTGIFSFERIIIGEMAEGCILMIDATQKPSKYFEVSVQLSDLRVEAIIYVYSIVGSNGVIELIIPSNENETSYSIQITKELVPDNFGLISVGSLEIRIIGIDHLSILSLESQISAYINGTPSDCDFLFNSISGSQIYTSNLQNNGLLINTTNFINWEIISSNITIVTAGFETIDYVNCSLATQALYSYGALFNYPFSSKVQPSSWMLEQIEYYGITNFQSNASLINFQTSKLNIEIPNLHVYEMDREFSAFHLTVLNGNVTMNASIDSYWQNTTFSGPNLEITGKLLVTLSPSYSAWISPLLFQGLNSSVIIDNNEEQEESIVSWIVGNGEQYLKWNDSNSRGYFSSEIVNPPNFIFSGNGKLNVIANLFTNDSMLVRNIVIENERISVSNSFPLSNQTQPVLWLDLLVTQNIDMNFSIHILDSINNIYYSPLNNTPIFTIAQSASINFTSLNANLSIRFPYSNLFFDYSTSAIYQNDSQSDYWLQPSHHCNPYFWTEVLVHGPYPCDLQTDYSIILDIDTNSNLTCNVPSIHNSSFSIQVNWKDKINRQIRNPWMLKLFSFFYFINVLFCALPFLRIVESRHPFLQSFFNFQGVHALAAWSFAVWTCFVARLEPNKEKWTLDAFYLTHVAREVVTNLFTGWFCDLEDNALVLSAVLLWAIPLIDILTIIILGRRIQVMIGTKTGDAKKQMEENKQFRRLEVFFNFGLLIGGTLLTVTCPFAISHISKYHLETIATIIIFAILLTVMIILAFLYLPTKWKVINYGFMLLQYSLVIIIALLGNTDIVLSYDVTFNLSVFFFSMIITISTIRIIIYYIKERKDKVKPSLFFLSLFFLALSVCLGTSFAIFLLKVENQTESILYTIWLLWMSLPFATMAVLLFYILFMILLVTKCLNIKRKKELIEEKRSLLDEE